MGNSHIRHLNQPIEMHTIKDHSSYIAAAECFINTTLGKQHSIAIAVRGINNNDRILFDKNFKPNSVIRYGNYRVDVDETGREAILSEGAQRCFNVDQYYGYVAGFPSVVRVGDTVILRKL